MEVHPKPLDQRWGGRSRIGDDVFGDDVFGRRYWPHAHRGDRRQTFMGLDKLRPLLKLKLLEHFRCSGAWEVTPDFSSSFAALQQQMGRPQLLTWNS